MDNWQFRKILRKTVLAVPVSSPTVPRSEPRPWLKCLPWPGSKTRLTKAVQYLAPHHRRPLNAVKAYGEAHLDSGAANHKAPAIAVVTTFSPRKRHGRRRLT